MLVPTTRQQHRERASLARFAGHRDLSAVRRDDMAHHRQSDAGAFHVRGRGGAFPARICERSPCAPRAAIPGPLSRTRMATYWSSTPHSTHTVGWSGEYLMALSTRFRSATEIASGSASMRHPDSVPLNSICRPAPAICGSNSDTTRCTKSGRIQFLEAKVRRARSMRPKFSSAFNKPLQPRRFPHQRVVVELAPVLGRDSPQRQDLRQLPHRSERRSKLVRDRRYEIRLHARRLHFPADGAAR